MEHIIQETESDNGGFHKGEKFLCCTSCGEWVSTWDDQKVINDFKESSCPGTRQHDDDKPVYSSPFYLDGGNDEGNA